MDDNGEFLGRKLEVSKHKYSRYSNCSRESDLDNIDQIIRQPLHPPLDRGTEVALKGVGYHRRRRDDEGIPEPHLSSITIEDVLTFGPKCMRPAALSRI